MQFVFSNGNKVYGFNRPRLEHAIKINNPLSYFSFRFNMNSL